MSVKLSHLPISISFSIFIILLFPLISFFCVNSLETTENSKIFEFICIGFPLLSANVNKIGIFEKSISPFGFWYSFDIIENWDLFSIWFNLIIKKSIINIVQIIVNVAPTNVLYKYFFCKKEKLECLKNRNINILHKYSYLNYLIY